MPKVYIPPQLRDLTGGQADVEVSGQTVGRVIAALDAQFPGLAARLRSGDAIAPGLAVSVDGAMVPAGLLARVEPQSEVHFLPAIGGG